MANQFDHYATVTDGEIAAAMFFDAELFACVFHELSKKEERRLSEVLEEAADQMSREARAIVRELAAKIDLVEAQP